MHTPEEAGKLWCPMVRMPTFAQARGSNPQVIPANRGEGGLRYTGAHCIANSCAMWRWSAWERREERAIVDDPSMGPGGKRETTVPKMVGTHGYCGLASRPEEHNEQ